ncbi:MAG: acylneuraminate cytidylyltransferase family protein [Bacteroides sp.]|nr:acylneuraminate cytidylyltransferase family protein [Eubacterium sp.]MCM1417975.1 acylneuraminate cytidylyltransferase family protein [Roseburia sp.]MCM1461778.1 acylneuraminate cytidylyltransferase family protein [Bacteroides sp.]
MKNKNIRLLNGYPMIAYTIAAAKLTESIDRVIVSTDSEEYAKIARRYGAETPFLRPAEISGDRATDLEFMQHAINWFYENEGGVPEYWVHLRPTNPLRDCKVIEEAIHSFKYDESADSLRSAHPISACPFKWFWLDGGYYKAFNGISLDEANKPRQAFPTVYVPDGYADVLRSSYIIKHDRLHGERMVGFCSPDCIDVDNMHDIEELERLGVQYQGDVIDYIKRIREDSE